MEMCLDYFGAYAYFSVSNLKQTMCENVKAALMQLHTQERVKALCVWTVYRSCRVHKTCSVVQKPRHALAFSVNSFFLADPLHAGGQFLGKKQTPFLCSF